MIHLSKFDKKENSCHVISHWEEGDKITTPPLN